MKSIIKWLKIIRPGTLFASVSPVVIGLLVANKVVDINCLVAVITIVCALSIQILSNFINDYFDFKRGLDKKDRLGPKRALAEGTIDEKTMKKAIGIDLAITLLSGAYLIYVGGLPILLIGVFSIIFAWLYTATSHSLSYLGIADIFVFVFFGLLATTGTTFLQTHTFILQSFLLGAVCGSVSTCVLVVNNIRDIASDKENNKKSFVVRFGKKSGYGEYLFFVLLTFVFSFLACGLSITNLVSLFGLAVFFMVIKAKGRQYNKCLVFTGLLNVVFVVLFAIDSCLR
ncbi:MAG: 1,4-dihydroxy-2-naphthoate octaprenyltransferase [Bacteroidales bacterium]|jgi:1,4-dihydroxy-2-naphthoate octaprenyltransferase|nr:1,4-dihydroxy-2-naphthoate octaprenyltransferase [Bacteroidales bacterium]